MASDAVERAVDATVNGAAVSVEGAGIDGLAAAAAAASAADAAATVVAVTNEVVLEADGADSVKGNSDMEEIVSDAANAIAVNGTAAADGAVAVEFRNATKPDTLDIQTTEVEVHAGLAQASNRSKNPSNDAEGESSQLIPSITLSDNWIPLMEDENGILAASFEVAAEQAMEAIDKVNEDSESEAQESEFQERRIGSKIKRSVSNSDEEKGRKRMVKEKNA